jgi:hypothetical protein
MDSNATTAKAFKAWVNSDAPFKLAHARPSEAAQPLVPHHLGALVGHLNTVCGSDDARRLFLHYCFGVDSSKALHVRQINALYYWLRVAPDREGKWSVTNAKASATAAAVVAVSRLAAGQVAFEFEGGL